MFVSRDLEEPVLLITVAYYCWKETFLRVRTRRDGNPELGLMWSGSFVTYTVQYIKLDKICAILFDAGHSRNKCLMARFSS